MNCIKPILVLIIGIGQMSSVYAWGFYGHRKINELAVYTLPPEMFGFFKKNLDYLRDHAVDADKRRYAIEQEACRHFLDADHYESELPLDTLPQSWSQAVAIYSEDSLVAHGIVPWYSNLIVYNLTEAFKTKNREKILKYAADLGHYIGDLHVPLHASSNYNGQKTGQNGIHGLWESRLPELFNENYDLLSGKCEYIDHVQSALWASFSESVRCVDSVLYVEKELTAQFPSDKKYTFEEKGTVVAKVYSVEFSKEYQNRLNEMVERRMYASIKMLGNVWYTAWVNAGQPDLDSLISNNYSGNENKEQIELELNYNKGEIIGRPEDH